MKGEGKVYINAMLPLDLGQQKIFNAVADPLEWCVIKEGVNIIYHYLGNFALLTPSSEECDIGRQTLKSVCDNLGAPLASEKLAGSSTCIEFLGIIIDTVQLELQLTRNNCDRLLRVVRQQHAHKSCAKRELESLIGTASCLDNSLPRCLFL